jgi:hypothetical protein
MMLFLSIFCPCASRAVGVSARAVTLNDFYVKAQQRHGDHDRRTVYTHEGLYGTARRNRKTVASQVTLALFARRLKCGSRSPRVGATTAVSRPDQLSDSADATVAAAGGAQSDVQLLYDKHRG